jgi:hypothetical protein
VAGSNLNLPVVGQQGNPMKNITIDGAILLIGSLAIITISAFWLVELFNVNPII